MYDTILSKEDQCDFDEGKIEKNVMNIIKNEAL